jgi:hypothetical protein
MLGVVYCLRYNCFGSWLFFCPYLESNIKPVFLRALDAANLSLGGDNVQYNILNSESSTNVTDL